MMALMEANRNVEAVDQPITEEMNAITAIEYATSVISLVTSPAHVNR